MGTLFRQFDLTGDGNVTYDEFLTALKGELTPDRLAIVDKAFELMDKDGSGYLSVEDLKGVYNCKMHPAVLEGTRSEESVMAEFLDSFEGVRGDDDGKITLTEWRQYYEEISASIPLDAYFVTMMESAWCITLDDTADAKELARFEKMLKDKISERTHGAESGHHALQRMFRFYDKVGIRSGGACCGWLCLCFCFCRCFRL